MPTKPGRPRSGSRQSALEINEQLISSFIERKNRSFEGSNRLKVCPKDAAAASNRGEPATAARADGERFPPDQATRRPASRTGIHGSPRSSHGQAPRSRATPRNERLGPTLCSRPRTSESPRVPRPETFTGFRSEATARRPPPRHANAVQWRAAVLVRPGAWASCWSRTGDAARGGLVGEQRRRSISFVACRTDR